MKIIIVDIETTAFLQQGGKIVEIGIVELNLKNGVITKLFDSLVKEPGLDESHKEGKFGWIFKNSDLKFEDLQDAPSLEELRPKIQNLFRKYYATAFNKKFDFDFLRNRGFMIRDLDCPMLVATDVCKLPGKFSLYKWPKVQEAYDFLFGENDYIEKHRGCDDAIHEAQIVYELYKRGHFQIPSYLK